MVVLHRNSISLRSRRRSLSYWLLCCRAGNALLLFRPIPSRMLVAQHPRLLPAATAVHPRQRLHLSKLPRVCCAPSSSLVLIANTFWPGTWQPYTEVWSHTIVLIATIKRHEKTTSPGMKSWCTLSGICYPKSCLCSPTKLLTSPRLVISFLWSHYRKEIFICTMCLVIPD